MSRLDEILTETVQRDDDGSMVVVTGSRNVKYEVKALFLDLIGSPTGLVRDSLPQQYDDPVEQFKAGLRRKVENL